MPASTERPLPDLARQTGGMSDSAEAERFGRYPDRCAPPWPNELGHDEARGVAGNGKQMPCAPMMTAVLMPMTSPRVRQADRRSFQGSAPHPSGSRHRSAGPCCRGQARRRRDDAAAGGRFEAERIADRHGDLASLGFAGRQGRHTAAHRSSPAGGRDRCQDRRRAPGRPRSPSETVRRRPRADSASRGCWSGPSRRAR